LIHFLKGLELIKNLIIFISILGFYSCQPEKKFKHVEKKLSCTEIKAKANDYDQMQIHLNDQLKKKFQVFLNYHQEDMQQNLSIQLNNNECIKKLYLSENKPLEYKLKDFQASLKQNKSINLYYLESDELQDSQKCMANLKNLNFKLILKKDDQKISSFNIKTKIFSMEEFSHLKQIKTTVCENNRATEKNYSESITRWSVHLDNTKYAPKVVVDTTTPSF
jgi:hypothetical protein